MDEWDVNSDWLKNRVEGFDERYKSTLENNKVWDKIITRRSDLLSFGKVEPNIMTMWTGCIFETPPGWGLLITQPINDYYRYDKTKPYTIQTGILETDWMVYDIWVNVAVTENCTFTIEKDKPIATLIPIRRDTYEDKWDLEVGSVDKLSYKRWLDYNYRKYGAYRHEKENKTETDKEIGNIIKNQKVYHQQRKRNSKPTSEFLGKDYEIRQTWVQEREGLDE